MNRFLPSLKKIAAARMNGAGWVPLPPCSPRPRSHPTYSLHAAKSTAFSGILLSVPLFLLVFGVFQNPVCANNYSKRTTIESNAFKGTSCKDVNLSVALSKAPFDLPQNNQHSITTKLDHSQVMTYLWSSGYRPRARDKDTRFFQPESDEIHSCFDVKISAKKQRGNDLSY